MCLGCPMMPKSDIPLILQYRRPPNKGAPWFFEGGLDQIINVLGIFEAKMVRFPFCKKCLEARNVLNVLEMYPCFRALHLH